MKKQAIFYMSGLLLSTFLFVFMIIPGCQRMGLASSTLETKEGTVYTVTVNRQAVYGNDHAHIKKVLGIPDEAKFFSRSGSRGEWVLNFGLEKENNAFGKEIDDKDNKWGNDQRW